MRKPNPAGRVPQMLDDCRSVYLQRGQVYGKSYQELGPTMTKMFPDGVVIKTAAEWNRWGVFMHVMTKVMRYRMQMGSDNCDDTLKDLAVYATMLREVEEDAQNLANDDD